jgi:hypothetical protein
MAKLEADAKENEKFSPGPPMTLHCQQTLIQLIP